MTAHAASTTEIIPVCENDSIMLFAKRKSNDVPITLIAILVFVLYWISKIIEEETKIQKFLLLTIKVNYEEERVILSFENTYLVIFLSMLFVLCLFIYKKKDLKLNS